MADYQKSIDGFRFVTELNTIVRNLRIVSQIVKLIGSKHLPVQFLKSALIKWSTDEEKKSTEYKKHHGKITEGGEPTTAFKRYLDFTSSLGLISNHGDLFMLSRLGSLLDKLLNQTTENESLLAKEEKLFYLISLFQYDADALLLTIHLLTQYSELIPQERLLEQFEAKLKERLLIKQRYAKEHAQSIIRDKYRMVEYEWKNAESYAKHIIPPRLEWMADLGILDRIQKNKKTFYQLNPRGKELYESCLSFPDANLRDINESWLRTKAVNSFAPVIFTRTPIKRWAEITKAEKLDLLVPFLEDAFNHFNFEGAMRISLYHSFLFIIIKLAITQNIVIEFNELENEFKNSVLVGNRKYSVRPSARINEGYITVNLI